MTYNEWRDELKQNLLCVTESERRRVLDYYAEAYADRRDAGFSEREIIEDFGAPYDAARRILDENKSEAFYGDFERQEQTRREKRRENRERRAEEKARREENFTPPPPPPPYNAPPLPPVSKPRGNYSWVFVLLCIIFAIPLFGLIMGMLGITVGLFVTPIAIVGSAAATVGMSIGAMFGGEVAYGFYVLGGGLIIFGIGIILFPICFKLIKLMWKLFNMFFAWLKDVFSGKKEIA